MALVVKLLASANVTGPGPLSLRHDAVRLPFAGNPSSVAVALKLAVSVGSVMV